VAWIVLIAKETALLSIFSKFAPVSDSVVQLDRMTDSDSVGWGFESPRGHENAKSRLERRLLIF